MTGAKGGLKNVKPVSGSKRLTFLEPHHILARIFGKHHSGMAAAFAISFL